MECMNAISVARSIDRSFVVAEIASGVVPGSNRDALAVEASLRTKGSVFIELLGAIDGFDLNFKIVVHKVAASRSFGFK